MNNPQESAEASPQVDNSTDGRSTAMYVWPLVAILVITVFLLRDQFLRRTDGVQSPAVGKPLAETRLAKMSSNSPTFTADNLKNRVTIMNFWGYWCPPCVAEFPELMALRNELSSAEEFQFISVACHAVPGKTDVLKDQTARFLEKHDHELTVYWDPDGVTRMSAAKAAEEEWLGYPTSLLIDRDGVIRGFWIGYSPAVISQLRSEATKLLREG